MTMHMRILPREQLEELIEYLAATYPQAFFTKPHLKRPLKKDVLLDLERERVLDDEKREAAISFYLHDWNYEAALQVGAKRIDLTGKEVDTVTQQEQLEAQKRVRAGKERGREKKKAQEEMRAQNPVMVLRNLHNNGKISTDQLSKISVTANARTPMIKATKTPPPPNGVDLTKLRTLWGSIEGVLSTDDENLRAALVAPALKVFVAEANKLIVALEAQGQ